MLIGTTAMPLRFLSASAHVIAANPTYAIFRDFFCREIQQFLVDDLLPLGRDILQCCLDGGSVADYEKLIAKHWRNGRRRMRERARIRSKTVDSSSRSRLTLSGHRSRSPPLSIPPFDPTPAPHRSQASRRVGCDSPQFFPLSGRANRFRSLKLQPPEGGSP